MIELGSWNIGPALVGWLEQHLPPGKIILELGSGAGSQWLSRKWTVYSVEHDKKWLGAYDTNYIYAPIEDGWYDLTSEVIPDHDLLLVDGPPGDIGRKGLIVSITLFDLGVPIIVDDTQRNEERWLARELSDLTGRSLRHFPDHHGKKFAVI